jgi:integrase
LEPPVAASVRGVGLCAGTHLPGRARTDEVLKAKWPEFNLDGEEPMWIVPADRMKAKREHRVPLTPRAVELVRAMQPQRGESEYVFPSPMKNDGKHLSDMALLVLVKRLAGEKFTTHGFRSSFRDWVSERTDFDSNVAEMALAHVVKNQAEAAYRRGDLMEKRRALMAAWSSYCTGDSATD